jgi:Ca2+:H+ antiporter
MGSGIGGLLNATFGNAAELIIALMALRAGLYDVVKASITGSIIGNILLVLGLAVLAGGVKHRRQTFNRTSAGIGATLLVLSAIGLVVPAIFHHIVSGTAAARERQMSLEIAIVLFTLYLASLFFSLKTHRHLYTGESTGMGHAHNGNSWTTRKSIVVLALATAGVALMSEALVGAVEATASSLGLTEVFVGVILVAIIGNAAEHSTAVLMAMKNEMDLAVNIAIGSSIQVALFVAPVLVFASYAFGRPMDLVFSTFEVVAVSIAAGVATWSPWTASRTGWKGAQLLAFTSSWVWPSISSHKRARRGWARIPCSLSGEVDVDDFRERSSHYRLGRLDDRELPACCSGRPLRSRRRRPALRPSPRFQPWEYGTRFQRRNSRI